MFRPYLTVAAIVTVAACSGDVTSVPTADAPSLDSALARDVMLASHEPAFDSIVEDTVDPSPPLTLKVIDPVRIESAKAQPAVVVAAPAPTPAAAPTPRTAPLVNAPETRSPQRSRVATVPTGTVLAVEASRRICVNTSKVGESFNGRLVRALPSRGGVSLPRGARVSGVVTSLVGSLGEERLEVALRSVTVDGKSYRVNSRVTDIQLDRRPGADRCIPDDGRITARLTQPLKIPA